MSHITYPKVKARIGDDVILLVRGTVTELTDGSVDDGFGATVTVTTAAGSDEVFVENLVGVVKL